MSGERIPLKLPFAIMLVPIPLGIAIWVLTTLFERDRPTGAGPSFDGPGDVVVPLLLTSVVAVVCTIVAMPLTLRTAPSIGRQILLGFEVAVLAAVAVFAIWLFK